MDTHSWSFYVYLMTTALFLACICTPYKIKDVTVYFGSSGLWDEGNNSTTSFSGQNDHYKTVQVLMSCASLAIGCGFIAYILLCLTDVFMFRPVIFVSQLAAGVFTLSAVVVFAGQDRARGDGWWLALTSGLLYTMNAVVTLVMPYLDAKHDVNPDDKTDAKVAPKQPKQCNI